MSLESNIEDFYQSVPVIPNGKNYWLIRTLSGDLYDTFIERNFVAIGYNEISLEAIHKINQFNKEVDDKLRKIKNLVVDTYENETRPGLIANQIFKFTYKLKKGDIVVIPSQNSDYVSFGIINDTPLLSVNYDKNDYCDFYRRKSVSWLKQIKRTELEPLLFKIFFSHNTLNNITPYGSIIESTLNNYFIKDDQEYVVFNIQRNEDISAIDLFQLGFYLLKLTEQFYIKNGLDFNIDDFDVKVNLNSKGKLKFIKKFGKGAFILALITIFINGGGGKISYGAFKLDISSDGLIQKIIDYQNNKFDRKMVEEIKESMDSLQIENPDDALELFRQFSVNKKTEE